MPLTLATGMAGRGYVQSPRTTSAHFGYYRRVGSRGRTRTAKEIVMEQRRLGRTEHLSSVVTFGAAGIGRVEQEVADRAIATALEHGVNHIDVAPRYGDAELRLRPWMPSIRAKVFLGCK